jgi:tetratricopeptide (TPR) repeat protein
MMIEPDTARPGAPRAAAGEIPGDASAAGHDRPAAGDRAPGASAAAARRRLALAAVLALAALLRLAHWAAVRDHPFFAELVMDSREYDRWAQEIAAGDWLGSTVFFQAPLYPYALATIYSVFGHRVDAVYLLQIAFALVGCWALYRAGRAAGGEGAGLAAALLAAVYPPFIVHDVQLAKESPAVALAALLLWALVVAYAGGRPLRWLTAGTLLGLLALLRENALLVAPLVGPLALWPRAGAKRAALRAGAFGLGLGLVLLPVAARNWAVGGAPLPTTFQGGVNFYIGNNPEADGTYRPLVPGKQVPLYERAEAERLAEQAAGRPLTPAEVSRHWLGRSLAWARREPLAFAGLQLRKLGLFWSWYEWPDAVDYYWVRGRSPALWPPWPEFGGVCLLAAAGLWWLRRGPGRFWPVLVYLVATVAATVVFFLFARYRLPAVPALMLLAALPVARLGAAVRARRHRPAAALALLVLAALVLPRLAGYPPRFDLVYYNLARLDQEAGRLGEAERHYRAALRHDPQNLLACLNLGTIAARRGDLASARQWFERAVAIEPRSDDAWANLGSAWLAAGDLRRAREGLERALELNPGNPTAHGNLELLERREGARPPPVEPTPSAEGRSGD